MLIDTVKEWTKGTNGKDDENVNGVNLGRGRGWTVSYDPKKR